MPVTIRLTTTQYNPTQYPLFVCQGTDDQPLLEWSPIMPAKTLTHAVRAARRYARLHNDRFIEPRF
jgi:hypothetical protein